MGEKIRAFGIILAAGRSERFKKSFTRKKEKIKDLKPSREVDLDLDRIYLEKPKCFIELRGKKLIEYSIQKFSDLVDFLVIATPPKDEEILIQLDKITKKYTSKGRTKEILVIYGGETRWQSFLNALKTIQDLQPKRDDIIVEHDGARPLFSKSLLEKVVSLSKRTGSAVPFINPYETVRTIKLHKIGTKNKNNVFLFDEEIDRGRVALIQTPQAFKYDLIENAIKFHTKKGKNLEDLKFTDLAGLIFASRQKVFGIKGERENIKITYFDDLKIAESILTFNVSP